MGHASGGSNYERPTRARRSTEQPDRDGGIAAQLTHRPDLDVRPRADKPAAGVADGRSQRRIGGAEAPSIEGDDGSEPPVSRLDLGAVS
jgi:hypothetical protein